MRYGLDGFHAYYSGIYGAARWNSLVRAMQRPVTHIAVPFPFSRLLPESKGDARSSNDRVLATKEPRDSGLSEPVYHLDAASVLPCVSLLSPIMSSCPAFRGAASSERKLVRVLDMCAAPGGKTVALANLLAARDSSMSFEIFSNDVSQQRRVRLRRVIEEWMVGAPQSMGKLGVIGIDATNPSKLFAKFAPHSFDFILVDAPCSSERHLLADPAEMEKWSPARTVQNAQRQLQLLLSAAHLIKPSGRVVYSTCSISPLENDSVVDNFTRKLERNLQRYGLDGVLDTDQPVRIVSDAPPEWHGLCRSACGGVGLSDLAPDRSERGLYIMPDRNQGGFGPMFVSVLQFQPPSS
eukprot:ANDGO_04833.mRNA.1 Ribosomal RNA small subunit methyltransferase F